MLKFAISIVRCVDIIAIFCCILLIYQSVTLIPSETVCGYCCCNVNCY